MSLQIQSVWQAHSDWYKFRAKIALGVQHSDLAKEPYIPLMYGCVSKTYDWECTLVLNLIGDLVPVISFSCSSCKFSRALCTLHLTGKNSNLSNNACGCTGYICDVDNEWAIVLIWVVVWLFNFFIYSRKKFVMICVLVHKAAHHLNIFKCDQGDGTVTAGNKINVDAKGPCPSQVACHSTVPNRIPATR
jgi:hypothetical protein